MIQHPYIDNLTPHTGKQKNLTLILVYFINLFNFIVKKLKLDSRRTNASSDQINKIRRFEQTEK